MTLCGRKLSTVRAMLTKLSPQGGFTANWDRRAFALIGSSLFYARDRSSLTAQARPRPSMTLHDPP